jgi:hypothetical protein
VKQRRQISSIFILSHLVAIYFIGLGFCLLSALLKTEGAEVLNHFRQTGFVEGKDDIILLQNTKNLTGLGMLVGVITGFILSIVVTVRKKRSWFNSLIAFACLWAVVASGAMPKLLVAKYIWFIDYFILLSAVPAYLFTGLLWLFVGVVFLLLPQFFIKKKKEKFFQFEEAPVAAAKQ